MAMESRISELLGRRRETITDFARGAEISYGTAHVLYHGTQKGISMEVMEKLCAYFGVQPSELFVYVPDTEEG